MTDEAKTSPSQKQAITLSPWLVIAGALLLYGITLNHWITWSSLPIVSKITGWDWHPVPLSWRMTAVHPLFLVLTSPIRILPTAAQPLALNAFTAICAALTLGLLAASVRLLPQDRTREQRQREGGEDALLSLRSAFLPQLFAVLVLGFHLTFWRNAISATGEMLDLLVFAFLIFCLLKYRVSQSDNWLYAFALVYGLGTTSDYALNYKGYFFIFFIALVWIKGVNFFNLRFLARMAGWGILGLLLYLLIPAMGSLGPDRADFGELLMSELRMQSYSLRLVPRWVALAASVSTILPLLFAGIKWPSFEGEVSAFGNALNKYMFRFLHVVFLLLALVLFFKLRYSPSQRLQEFASIQFLSFYYLAALGIGYFSGYVLLIFGKPAAQAWERPSPIAKAFNTAVVVLLCGLAIAAPCALVSQSYPSINAGKKDAMANFSHQVSQDLPDKAAIVLSDDPTRLYLLEATYLHEGKTTKNILIDTSSLAHREYIAYLVSRYPELKKLVTSPEKLRRELPGESLVNFLFNLKRTYLIYYVHPSFGYYFETFYLKPHGLVYEMETFPKDMLTPPVLTADEINQNQKIWDQIEKQQLPGIPAAAKLDPDTAMIGFYYSVGLDYFGVALQKAGHLPEAGAAFEEAVRVHPDNFVAALNKDYNDHLQKNDHHLTDSREVAYRVVNQYRGLRYNGPVDEPNMEMIVGEMLASQRNFRQATAMFERRLQLLPDDHSAEMDLAKVFVDMNEPYKAFGYIRKMRANPGANQAAVSRIEALAYYAMNDYKTAEQMMLKMLQEGPDDINRVAIVSEFYRVTAYPALREKNGNAEALRRFKNALVYLDKEVQILKANPEKVTDQTLADVLLNKAEVEMMVKAFADSITTLTQIIDLQPENQTALLNRAIAENQLHQFDAAIRDYNALRKVMRQQPYVVDFGLAEIAAEQKNPAQEIRYLKRYLDAAPDDSPEYQKVKQRLRKLESR